ncbi:putative molybdopterin biosynthesis protein [Evansella vedderi]|uniref:Molybdopterin molybdenumtransferase n=1 Tax=Evansella vedderi TaxID=38282 RepID=A0ABT9ZUG2_9BACI|nr:molybdopterin biosynthesis protein [Evansella vedderi]MDQ0254883.1 putative molybdopterin biosynthesis protein [Evansella vedderi]
MVLKRKIYLEDKPRDIALKECLEHFEVNRVTEEVRVSEALGRITAQPIYANRSMPHYHASAMDGIAVRAEMTIDAHENNPVHLHEGTEFVYVDTGNAIPPEYDAVIMIEDINIVSEGVIEIIAPATPWQRIRPIGEDITYGEMLLPQGHELRPVDMGALLAAGMKAVPVIKQPLVHIIPSGNEIVPVEENIQPGKIIEFNGTIFSGLVTEWGGQPEIQPIVKDEPEAIKEALLKSSEAADVVIINAGSSAGSKDYTASVIEEIGEVFTHGIATRPGKPVIIGKVNGTMVIGVPGYPVSAFLVMDWFVKPMLAYFLGIPVKERQKLPVIAGRRIVSNMGSEDFIRVNIGKVNGKYIANPLTRSSSVTMSLVKADGIVVIPPEHLGVEQGNLIEAELFRPVEEIESTILFSGSHDLCIDVLSTFLKEENHSSKITASHTGSMAGLMAIKRGEAHIAGVHLLDPETGEYNISYVERFLKDREVVLVPFLKRKQGWIVAKNNPLNIQLVTDLKEKGVTFVNRQRGAGTRILFDYLLSKEGVLPEEIIGYDREMFTHLAVSAEVNMHQDHAGMGIYSAAKAMNLDFVPVAEESYDLIMEKDFYESDKGKKLIEVMKNKRFKRTVEEFGGYEVCTDKDPVFFNQK